MKLDLHHIEAKDEVEWDDSFPLLTEHTDLLESQLTPFVLAEELPEYQGIKNHMSDEAAPVNDTDDSVEETVDHEGAPDALEDTAAPHGEQEEEVVGGGAVGEAVDVGHRHPGRVTLLPGGPRRTGGDNVTDPPLCVGP